MIGTTISHYKIVKRLGEGGMGVVYLAEDQHLQRQCAIKLLSPKTAVNDDVKRRFKREAQAIATINHPNIVTIYELGEYEDNPYIIMEYIDGQSLREILRAKSKIPVDESIEIMRKICNGLNKAHFAGIIHRDLKPENILINKDGDVKILDFGLAKLKGSSNITTTNSRIGTIYYMSPEQVHGYSLKPCSDIFSLGIIFYEMLTGKVPFKGEYDVAVIYSILNDKPEPLKDLALTDIVPLQEIIDKAISKDMDSRYQSSEEFLDALIDYSRSKHSKIQDKRSDIEMEVNHSIESLMAHREKIDEIIEKEYKKNIVIMFCDIVGSTSFFEQYGDIEGRVMVKRFTGIAFPIIEAHNGIVIKTMGDGILASFENPVNASDCAIGLQKSFHQKKQDKKDKVRIQIRIAMHFGKAVIDQEDVYGDVVNVAARLEKHTEPNQILISEPMYLKIIDLNTYICKSIGKFSFKGKSESMALYRLRWYEDEDLDSIEVAEVSQKSVSQNIILKKEFSTPQPEVIVSDKEYGKNPYMNRVMIRNSEEFFGRKKEISKIYSRIGSIRPQSVSVVGERRIGKSSLLNFIYNPINRRQFLQEPDKYVFIFVDFQEKRGIDIPEFFATLYGCLIKEFNNQLEINLKPDYDGFKKIVQYLDGEDLKLILVFDEFELITKNKNFGTEFYSYIRSLANNFNVAYLVSSGRNLQTMCHSREISNSPFFNIFSNIRLGQFNMEDALDLITVPSKLSGYPLDAYVDTIIEIAGFYPFFIQMACGSFFEIIRQYGKLNKNNFIKVKEEFLDEAKIHFRQIWDIITQDQQILFLDLANRRKIKPQQEYLIQTLITSGYIRLENNRPVLFSSVFAEYILEHFDNENISIKKKKSIFNLFQ